MAETETEKGAGLRLKIAPVEGIAKALRLSLSGGSDRSSNKQLQETVDGLVETGTTKLLLDCERLEYLNSTALGYLINLVDRLERLQGALAFLRVPSKVRMVFELLGLRDFFPGFDSEAKAVAYLSRLAPSRAEGLAPSRVEGPAAGPASRPPAPPAAVAPPEAPPLNHPRWSVFMETVADRVGQGAIERLQKSLGVLPESQPVLLIRGILRRLGSPRELLGQLEAGELAEMCAAYRLPRQGTPAQLVERLLAFVQRSTTVSLSEILHAGQEIAPLDFAMLPVELTADNVRRVLENCALPRRIPGERAVRDVIHRRLAKVFVHEKVRRRQAVGPLDLGEVDIEVAAAFGIEVRLAAGLLGSGKDLQRLLGRLAVAARHYAKGSVFAVVAGEVPSSKAAALDEVRALVERVGADWVRLPPA